MNTLTPNSGKPGIDFPVPLSQPAKCMLCDAVVPANTEGCGLADGFMSAVMHPVCSSCWKATK